MAGRPHRSWAAGQRAIRKRDRRPALQERREAEQLPFVICPAKDTAKSVLRKPRCDPQRHNARGNDFMDRMLVVVFDNENKAYDGKKALLQLDDEGSISVYGYAVLAKDADGKATIKQGDDVGPIGTLFGTSLGSLVGLLGGPVGLAAGAAAGALGGAAADLDNSRIGSDF